MNFLRGIYAVIVFIVLLPFIIWAIIFTYLSKDKDKEFEEDLENTRNNYEKRI